MKLTVEEIEKIISEEWLKRYQLISDPDLLHSMAEKIVEAENGKNK